MRYLLSVTTIAAIVISHATHVDALTVSLSSSASLGSLSVGETFTVDVNLADLVPGDELTLLSAQIAFDGAILGVPTVSGGVILPNPLNDPLDFSSIESAGLADATFFTLGPATADHITNNGIFYSIELTALSPGLGQLLIAFLDAQQMDPTDPGNLVTPELLTGNPLTFQIVPETSTLTLLSIGFFFAIQRRFRR